MLEGASPADAALYDQLVAGRNPVQDAFDVHVLACVLTLACAEARELGCGLCERLGLEPAEVDVLQTRIFSKIEFPAVLVPDLAAVSPEETCLRQLLERFATPHSWLSKRLVPVVARRAVQRHHLWQDLGLQNRDELSRFMQRHFKPLADKNAQDMKWKKFLSRMICMDDSYGLCPAPTCSDCTDVSNCFGDEVGPSLLARSSTNPPDLENIPGR
ncbi:MAG TPA: nitrogen fixation protein NifQ [Fibrobacteria bacterium]|nr:nitrogen fixation protein NifQ [Fibrobacteria bacterium]